MEEEPELCTGCGNTVEHCICKELDEVLTILNN